MEVKNKKLKQLGKEEAVLILQDGRTVIGMQTDDKNKLFYVFKDGDEVVVEPAQGQRVAEVIHKKSTSEVFIPVAKKNKP